MYWFWFKIFKSDLKKAQESLQKLKGEFEQAQTKHDDFYFRMEIALASSGKVAYFFVFYKSTGIAWKKLIWNFWI